MKPANVAGLYLAWVNPRQPRVRKARKKRQVTPGYAFGKQLLAYQAELMRRLG